MLTVKNPEIIGIRQPSTSIQSVPPLPVTPFVEGHDSKKVPSRWPCARCLGVHPIVS